MHQPKPQLKRSSKPVVGVLPHRCPACNCDWGYIDGDIPTTLGELLSDYASHQPRNPAIICGQCGRNIDVAPVNEQPQPTERPPRQPTKRKQR